MSNDIIDMEVQNYSKGNYLLSVRFKNPNLAPGVYIPAFAVYNNITGELYEKIYLNPFRIEGNLISRGGLIHLESNWNIGQIN